MPATKNFYEVLGVSKNANDEEIKSAYKKQALKTHPDKNGNSPESEAAFKEVGTAYDVLKDAEKRKVYDQTLHAEAPKPSPTKPSYAKAKTGQAQPQQSTPAPKAQPQQPKAQPQAQPQANTYTRPSSFWSKQSRPEPKTYAGFFEKEEDFFRPADLDDEDVFVPYVARSPLNEIFNALKNHMNQRATYTPTESTSASRTGKAGAPSPAPTPKQHAGAEKSDFSCKKETAKKPATTAGMPEVEVTFVFVQAPSRVDLANLIAQALLLNALMVQMMINANLERENHYQTPRPTPMLGRMR